MKRLQSLVAAIFIVAGGCAIHPEGEKEERERALQAGEAFSKPFDERELPALAPDADWPDVLRHALLANAELEERYWDWRASLERIPQEASPDTTAFLGFGYLFSSGSATAWDRSTVTLGVDPMDNLPWPGKLAAAGRVALEEARAAGLRFERAKFELQEKVLSRYYEFALLGEQIRIRDETAALLAVVFAAAQARARAAGASQSDLSRAHTALDLARNEALRLRARVPGARAELNALLSRPADAALDLPASLPAARIVAYRDDEILRLAAERNPELRALAAEASARREGIGRARLERVPEFSASGAIMGDATEMLTGAISMSFLRFEAIEAGIEQSRAELRAALAVHRQAVNDVAARATTDLFLRGDVERQLELFRDVIEPRARQSVHSTRAAYTIGRAPLSDLLEGQRVLLDARLAVAELRMEREKAVARLEALAAVDVSSPEAP